MLVRYLAAAARSLMTDRGKFALRVVAIIMGLAAFAWGAEVVRQALQADDGGPPLGAICMAVPAFGLLIGAGAVWSSTNRRNARQDFDVMQKK
jgi:hypothetical protein